jgi:23S rRNA pseudouridine2457 synthase
MVVAFHKPYGVLSQFTPEKSPHRTLADFGLPPGIYPVGRLDADSEGLLILADEPGLNDQLLNPAHGHEREYWVEVERVPPAAAIARLSRGVVIEGRRTRPCTVQLLDPQPALAPRVPPIRVRKSIPTCWISIALTEGRNRQVRKMTAAIDHPTLRLVRVRIGRLLLGALAPGQWRTLGDEDRRKLLR